MERTASNLVGDGRLAELIGCAASKGRFRATGYQRLQESMLAVRGSNLSVPDCVSRTESSHSRECFGVL